MMVWVINPQVSREQERPLEHSPPLAAVAAAFIIQHHGEPPAAEESQRVSGER